MKQCIKKDFCFLKEIVEPWDYICVGCKYYLTKRKEINDLLKYATNTNFISLHGDERHLDCI